MANNQLSAAEIEVLLGKKATQTEPPDAPAGAQLDDRIIERLSTINQRVARDLAVSLSDHLHRIIRVRVSRPSLVSNEQLDTQAGQFPYRQAVTRAGYTSPWSVFVASATLYSMVDSMLGGGQQPSTTVSRPPTEIERRLMDRAIRLLLDAMQANWRDDASVQLELSHPLEKGPIVGGVRGFVSTHFEVEVGRVDGKICVAIPIDDVERLLNPAPSSLPDTHRLSDKNRSRDRLECPNVELIACLAELEIAPEELDSLSLGDILTTDQPADGPIAISLDDEVRFHARIGSWQGRKAVEIEDVSDSTTPNDDNDSPPATS